MSARRQRSWRCPLLVMLAAGGAAAEDQAPAAPEPPQAIVHAIAEGYGPVAARGGASLPLTLRLRGDAARIEFSDPKGRDAYLLVSGPGREGWLVSVPGNVAMPLPRAGTAFWFDPEAPCETLQATCSPAPGEVIAGRAARGWRYRNAAGRGPDGTDSGTLWVDAATGLLLGYRGKLSGRDEARSLRTVSVSYASVPADIFERPRNLQELQKDR